MALGYRYIPNVWMALRQLANRNVWEIVDTGAPTNGTSGTGAKFAGPGSIYINYSNGNRYANIGTKLSPLWHSIGSGNDLRTVQTTNTIAEVNAGATILAAVAGYKYQIVDAVMISVGGAVGAATTVDIGGTQATVAVKLLAVAIAALTQSAVVRAGATNATVLADAASFGVCDVNTAITIGKTGATATTATHVYTAISYRLVAA